MPYELPNLNFEYDALEPHLDALTMEIHHSKHQIMVEDSGIIAFFGKL